MMPMATIHSDDGSSQSEDYSDDQGGRTIIMDRFFPAAKAMASLPYLMKPAVSVDDTEDEFSFKACGFWSWRLKNAFTHNPTSNKKYSSSLLSAGKKLEYSHPHRPCNASDYDTSEEERGSTARRKSREGTSRHGKHEKNIVTKNKSGFGSYSGSRRRRRRSYSRGFPDPNALTKIGDALMNRISYRSEPRAPSPKSRSPLKEGLSSGISPYRNEAPVSPFREEKGFLGFPRHSRAYSPLLNKKDGFNEGRGDNNNKKYNIRCPVSPRPVRVSGVNEENEDSGHLNERSDGDNKYYASCSEGVMAPPLPKSPSESWLSRAMPLVISLNSQLSPGRGYGKSIKIQRESFEDSFDDAKWETV